MNQARPGLCSATLGWLVAGGLGFGQILFPLSLLVIQEGVSNVEKLSWAPFH